MDLSPDSSKSSIETIISNRRTIKVISKELNTSLPLGSFSDVILSSVISPTNSGRRSGLELPKDIPLDEHLLENVEAYWNAAKSPDIKSKIKTFSTEDSAFKNDNDVLITPISSGMKHAENNARKNSTLTNLLIVDVLSNSTELQVADRLPNDFSGTSISITTDDSCDTLFVNQNFKIPFHDSSLINDASTFSMNISNDLIVAETLDCENLSFTKVDPDLEMNFTKTYSSNSSQETSSMDYADKQNMEEVIDNPQDCSNISFSFENQYPISISEEVCFEYEQPVVASFSNSDSNENQYEDIADESAISRVRRSQRKKYQPLAFWKNERVIYGRRESCAKLSLPAILDVIRFPETNDNVSYKRLNSKKRRIRRNILTSSTSRYRKKSRKAKILALANKLERLGFEECKEVSGPIISLYSDDSKEILQPLMVNHNQSSTLITTKDSFAVFPSFTQNGIFSSGSLILPPKYGKKSNSNSGCMSLIFHMNMGICRVTIHSTTFIATEGSEFRVPPNNQYEIVNESVTEEARLFFVNVNSTFENKR